MNDLVKVENNKISISEETIKKLRDYAEIQLEADMFMKELKENLLNLMESNGIQESFEIHGLKVTYKKPSTRTTLDSKKIKEELPDIYDKYSKTSDVKSSVSIEFLC